MILNPRKLNENDNEVVSNLEETDIVIIGAGPIGVFAAFQFGMLNLRCCIIDALDKIGGQCMMLYPKKPIYDIPGYSCITGEELINKLVKQADAFNPIYHLGSQIMSLAQLDNDGKLWELTTSKGKKIQSKAIVIAAGSGLFIPNKPKIDGLENFEGRSVFYSVSNLEEFVNKDIVIAGGGDSAVDWAINLSDVASSITIIHRRNQFRALPKNEEYLRSLVQKNKIKIITPYNLHSIHGKDGYLQSVLISTLDNEIKKINANILLLFFGLSMNLGIIKEWGLELKSNHIETNQSSMETNRRGIYAIGDIATYKNKIKLILCGFSEAAIAAYSIRNFLNPNKIFHFEYSTIKGIQDSIRN